MSLREEAERAAAAAPARLAELQAATDAAMRKILDAKAVVEAAQMTGPVPDRLTLANAARELLREAEAEAARNKAKLEEYLAEIRQLMGTL